MKRWKQSIQHLGTRRWRYEKVLVQVLRACMQADMIWGLGC
jgi:hypothetical protein